MTFMNPLTDGNVPVAVGWYRGLIGLALISACTDAAGVLQQVDLISIAGAENSSAYSIRAVSSTPGVNFDATWSYTTDGSATATELQEGLIAAIEADAAHGRVFSRVEAVSTNQIRITWAGGRAGTLSFPANPTTDLTTATTAAGFTAYEFGEAVQIGANGTAGYAPGTGGGTIVWDLTTNNNSQAITASFTVAAPDGSISIVNVSATSSSTAALTTDAIIAAFTSAFPLGSVVETTADDVVTVTLPPGYSAVRTAFSTGTVVATLVTAVGSPLPEIGIVLRDRSCTAPLESITGPASVVGPVAGTPFNVLRASGGIEYIVPVASGTPAIGGPVYVDNAGGWHAAAAAGRTFARGMRWGSYTSTTFASIAL
jgi:hypothetical protein